MVKKHKPVRMPQVKGIGADKVVKSVAGVSKTVVATAALTQMTGTAVSQIAGMFHP